MCSFRWYFHKIVWWFYFNGISNCCVFASLPVYSNPPRLLTLEIFANLLVYCNLPVYYLGRNLPAFPFIPPSPSIWNLRVFDYILNLTDCINSRRTTSFWFLRPPALTTWFSAPHPLALSPLNWNLKNIIFEITVCHHRLCFQSNNILAMLTMESKLLVLSSSSFFSCSCSYDFCYPLSSAQV